jgi:choice-of-anchor C domain-containing protein
MKKFVFITALLLLALVFAPAGAQAVLITNLLTNGGFESGTDPPTDTPSRTLFAGQTSADDITGWTVLTGSVDWVNTYWTAEEGERSLDLCGNTVGAISTTFDTIPGAIYKVTFYVSGNFVGGDGTKLLQITADGQYVNIGIPTPTEWSTESMGWTQIIWTFTADDDSAQLTFAALNNNAYGPALDNVAVEFVPLPPTALLLGSGLLGLWGWRRKKNS